MEVKKYDVLDLFFPVLVMMVGTFLFWKCRFGFGNRDEAFYLTIPWRLYQGDALFSQEWHLSQMAGVLMWPFVSLYGKIVGSADGILLAFRYFCMGVWCIAACFFYFRLKKYGRVGAAMAAVSFLLYIPFGIMALSYNSLGILNMMLALVLAGTAENHKNLQFFFAGCFFAAAVLCCPYLVLVFVVYCMAAVYFGRRRHKKEIPVWLNGGSWRLICAGVFLMAVLFLIFVLSRTSPADIGKALPWILRDPQHPMESPVQSCASYIRAVWQCNKLAPWIFFGLLTITFGAVLDKKRMEHRAAYLTAVCVLVTVFLAAILAVKPYLNFVMFPVCLSGPYWFYFSRKRAVKELFYTFWIPGMLYSFCIHLSSNQGFYAISSASTVAAAGSLMMAAIAAGEMREAFLKAGILLVFGMQIFSEALLRYNSVFWETSMKDQTCLIGEGPEAGIYVTEDKKKLYMELRKDTEDMLSRPEVKNVLYLSRNTWLYLCGDAGFGTYSAWLSGIDAWTMEKLGAYYELNREKIPDAVYAEAEYEAEADWLCRNYNYTKYRTEMGFICCRLGSGR